MTPRYQDKRVAVYDDFLTGPQQREILEYFDTAKFRAILPDAWGRAFRLNSGNALVGVEVVSQKRDEQDRTHAFPTQTALDILIRRLLASRADISRIVGSFGETWTRFTMCPYVYPPGSALGWHTDAHCAGAYIYYAHPHWGIHWGGELLVEHAETDCVGHSVSSRGILRNEPLESALKSALGYYFGPVPNRLIVLKGGTPHMVKSVENAAGENLRMSISGFFL